MNKKGLANHIYLILIMAVVLILIVLSVFIWGLVGPPAVSITKEMGGMISTAMQETNDPNIINATESSITPAVQTLDNFEWISYTLVILSLLVFLVMCFFVRVYPFLVIIWIILIVILVFVSIYMAVVYQDVSRDPQFSAYYSSWENTDFILKNLPVILVIIGILGAIIMFNISSKGQIEEGGYTQL